MAHVEKHLIPIIVTGLKGHKYAIVTDVKISDNERLRFYKKEDYYVLLSESGNDGFYDLVREDSALLVEEAKLNNWLEIYEEEERWDDREKVRKLITIIQGFSKTGARFCACGGLLEFKASLAAPGKGESWSCRLCNREHYVNGKYCRPFDEMDQYEMQEMELKISDVI